MIEVNHRQPYIVNRNQEDTADEKGGINLRFFNLLMNVAIGIVFGFSIFIALIGLGAIDVLHLLVAGFPLFGAAASFFVLGLYLRKIKKEIMVENLRTIVSAYFQSEEGKAAFERIIREVLPKNRVN